jgi:septal ring-binding cell division protein DamX
MFRLLRGCATLIGMVVLVLIGIAVYRSLHQPDQARVGASPSAAASSNLNARLAATQAQIRQDAAAGRHEPITLTATDPELTGAVNQAIANGQSPVPVSNVQVSTVPGQVNIRGQLQTVVPVPFTMTAMPHVVDGKAQLEVTGIDFGGLPVPGPVANQLVSAVASPNLLGDTPLIVTTFQAQAGRLVLQGTT